MLTQGGRVGVRFRHTLVDQRTGGVGLRQRDAHLVVALKPQRPAEAEHRRLGHAALPRQRRDGQILRFRRMLQQIIRHGTARFCQVALMLLQQFPKIRCHFSFSPFSGAAAPNRPPPGFFTFYKKYKRIACASQETHCPHFVPGFCAEFPVLAEKRPSL